MKIWYQYPGPVNPFRQDVVWAGIHAAFDRVRRPDTEIVIHPTAHGADAAADRRTFYRWNLRDQEIIDTMAEAPDAGYDGAIIGVAHDSGLVILREILSIPVVGLMEAACHVATLWGDRYAIITVPGEGPALAKDLAYRRGQLERYGVADRCTEITPIDLPYEQFFRDLASGNHDPMLTRFSALAKQAVERGADVVIAGDTVLSTAVVEHGLFQVGSTGGVVVDLMAASVTLVELLVTLNRAHGIVRSRSGIYAAPASGSLAAFRQRYGR